MTHRIGIGTVNVSVNLLRVERNILGEISVRKDMSVGALIRRLALEGLRLRHPDLAAQIERSRRERRGMRQFDKQLKFSHFS